MKIKYKYWRIDGSCVAARRRQQRGATLLPYPFDGPHRVLPLSFSVRVSQRRNTIFPTFLSPLPQGKRDLHSRKKRGYLYTFIHVLQRNSSISPLSEWNLNIFIHYFITEGRDERWKHRVRAVFPLQRDL